MGDIHLTNASARLLQFALSQPELMTKTSDILRAGTVTKVLEELIPEQPELKPAGERATTEEAKAFNADLKAWNSTPFVLYGINKKTQDLACSVVTKLVEKGRLGASRDVVDLLTALGFSLED